MSKYVHLKPKATRFIRMLFLIAIGISGFFLLLLSRLLSFHNDNVTFEETDSATSELYNENRITVVTVYYQIASKHNHTEYVEWITNFLPNIPCHLYIFTNNVMLAELSALRKKFPDRTRFVIKELHELEEFTKMKHWIRMKSTDREVYHTPELYAIWNQKWHFVDYAIKENVFQSDYYIWCDIGSFRTPMHVPLLRTFPGTSNIEKFGDYSKITLLIMNPFDPRFDYMDGDGLPSFSLRNGSKNHIGGTLAGGHLIAWKLWYSRYYAMQQLFFDVGLNAGKDQNVMNAVAVKFPENVQLIRPESYFNDTGDPWFYLQYYFSV